MTPKNSAPQRLLCQRASDTFPRHGVKGGFDRCSQCAARVHVADTSREAIKIYTRAEIWCLDCCVQDPPPGGVELEYTDEQIAEIARVTGQDPAKILEQLTAVLPSLRKQETTK